MLEELYQGLFNDGHFTGSFEDFQVKFQDASYRKKLYGGLLEDKEFTGNYGAFENKFLGKTNGAAKVDATAAPQLVSGDTGLASEEPSSGLPQVGAEDTKIQEDAAVKTLEKKFSGLGFTFEVTPSKWLGQVDFKGLGFDYVDITSPPDADGNTTTETFSFEQGIMGFSPFGGAEREADKINAFIKAHANDSKDLDAGAYASAWKYANEAKTDFTHKDGSVKKASELTATELNNHATAIWNQVNERTAQSSEVRAIDESIISEMSDFDTELVASFHAKFADEIKKVQSDPLSEESSALMDLIYSEFDKARSIEFNKRRSESKELFNIFETNRKAVDSRFSSTIADLFEQEGEYEMLGESTFGRLVRDFPVLNNVVKGIYGTSALKLPKSWNEADALKLAKLLESATTDIKDLKTRDPGEKFEFSGEVITEFAGEEDLEFRYTPSRDMKKARLERAALDKDDPMWLPMEAVTSGTYKTGYWTVGERIEVLEKRQAFLREKVTRRLVDSDEYKQKLNKMITPEIFGESITSPDLTLDEYGRIVGDQAVQMIGAVLSGGASTFMQEAAGAFTETTTIKAMDKLFPIGSEIDMGITTSTIKTKEDQQRHFYDLPKEERFKAVLDVIESGEANLDAAVRVGVRNAAMDVVGNAIVITKAGKFLPKDLTRKLLTKQYKEFLKGGWKTMGKDVTIASFAEVVTEVGQEVSSVYGVGTATGDFGTAEQNAKRFLESGGQALIVTPLMVGGGQITTTTVKEIRNTVAALRDPESTRAYINKAKLAFDEQLKAGEITQEQRDAYFTELEAAEQVVNDRGDLKNLRGKRKQTAIDNVVKSNKLKEKNIELEESIKKAKKEVGEEAYGEFTTNDEIELKRNKKKVKDLEKKNGKLIQKQTYDDKKALIDWINNQNEGRFADKEMVTFKTRKAAEKWLDAKIKSGEIKPLTDAERYNILGKGNRGKANGMNLGKYAVMIDQNVYENIDKGDWSAHNVIHHEALHYILDEFTDEELAEFIEGTIKAMEASSDPKIEMAGVLLNKKMNVYRAKGRGVDTKIGKEEFFTTLSDALSYLDVLDMTVENGGVLADIGEMLQGMFNKNTKAGLDFSDLNAENTLQFIQKYNAFNGKGPKFKGVKLRGGKEVDKEDEVKFSESVAGLSKAVDAVNAIEQKIKDDIEAAGGTYTKDSFQASGRKGFDDIFYSLQPGGAISNYIKSLGMSPEKTQETIEAVTDRLINYDPLKERKDPTDKTPVTIGEFLMANIGYGKLVAAEKLFKEGEKRKVTQRLDAKDDSGRTVAETIADVKDEVVEDTKRVKKAREIKSLEDITLDNKDVISSNIEKKINDLIEQNPENLIEQLEELILKDFTKAVKAEMGKISQNTKAKKVVVSEDYKAHHGFNYQTYINALDVNTIKKNYNQLFDLKLLKREKDKKVDPITGKVTYPGKGIYDISTTKAKWTKYFTEGGYTTLLARQKKLAEFIAKDMTTSAINKQIAENSNDLNEVILAELREWSRAQDKQKGETISFDSVKFSATIRGFDPAETKDFYENLPWLNLRLQITNLNDEEAVKQAVKDTYGEYYTAGKVKKLGEDMFRLVNRYGNIEKRHANLKTKPEKTLNEYLFEELKVVELEKTLAEFLNLTDDKGKTLQLSKSFDKKDKINKARAEIVTIGKKWVKKYGKERALMMLVHASGMFTTSAKIGRGNLFKVNDNGVVVELDVLKDMSNKELLELAETMKDPDTIRPVQKVATQMELAGPKHQGALRNDLIKAIRKQRATAYAKSTGGQRYQVFNSKKDYNTWVLKEIFGDEIQLTDKGNLKKIQELTINGDKVKINTSLLAETSEAAMSDKDYAGRKKQAAVSEQVVKDMAQHYKDQIEAGALDKEDFAMMMMSMASNMQSPLKRAANLGYIFKDKKGQKYTGKLRYEHMIPTNYMVMQLTNAYMNDGSVNLNALFKEYTVAVIPVTMDNIFDEVGLTKTMNTGYRVGGSSRQRYYNMSTFGHPDLYAIESLNPKDKGKVYGEAVANIKFSESASPGNKALNKAIQVSRTISKPKGITVLDFDDTLATTKSGVSARIPNPDGTPKPGRKVIFMAGGAGSGKGNVISKLGLKEAGYKIVNSDISLEWLKKNHGLPENQTDYTAEQRSQLSKLTWEARRIAKRKQSKFAGKGDGIVVDGTGGSVKVMQAQVQAFKDKGYDVSMVFVETSLEVAQQRNAARKERSLKEFILNKNHEQVQGNKEAFKELFGENFNEISTDNIGLKDALPKKFKDKVDSFTNSYENRRLDAEEFAREGAEIKSMGGEFDFSEFNKVIDGKTAPLFGKAMKLAGKFGTDNMFILTARGPESVKAIKEFLDAQGLNIPLKNITGLGKSEASAKAIWIAEKVGEGYNDFYFADDAIQNVKAVKNMLNQFDVKSKVQQAKVDFVLGDPQARFSEMVDSNEVSINDIKNTNRLVNPGTYNNIKFSESHRSEYENTLSKHRPDLVKDGLVSKTVDNMFDFIDSLDIPADKKRKHERATTKWLATSNIKLLEDRFKIVDAIALAERFKLDLFSYNNPNEIIEAYAGKVKKKPLDPNKVTEFGPGVVTNEEYNITEHVVDNTKEGQKAVRDIIDSHWGEKSNPWCITQKKHGKLTEDSWDQWQGYSDKPKSIVFQDGKLLAFKANGLHWDRMDNDTKHPIVNVKEGRVTTKFELRKKRRAVERVTISEDGKTTTTEYLVETNTNTDGEKTVEERNNGRKTKVTEFSSRGVINKVTTFDTNGNITGIRGYDSLGWMSSLNNGVLYEGFGTPAEFLGKEGDIATREYYDSKTRMYTFAGMVLYEGQVRNLNWQGLDGALGADLKNVTSEVDGKIRLDLKKILELDPNAKGIPETGVKFSESMGQTFNDILENITGIDSKKRFSQIKGRKRGASKGKFRLFIPPSHEDFVGLLYNFIGKGKKGDAHRDFFERALIRPLNRAYREIDAAKQAIANDYRSLNKSFPNVKKKLNKKTADGDFTFQDAIRVYLWDKHGHNIPGLTKTDQQKLVDLVKNDPDLHAYAETLNTISKQEAYVNPSEGWEVGDIRVDLNDATGRVGREQYFAEFNENVEIIFSKQNLNKIEAAFGKGVREAIEDSLYRTKTGMNRPKGQNELTNRFMNYLNASVGSTMFFNMRSALLQQMSIVNYINFADNNIFTASKAFANQKQYWADWAFIFNSDTLKQRRSGIKTDVNGAELAAVMSKAKMSPRVLIAKLLELGFTPTQIFDNIAIATGGATFYRNRVNTYIKQGLSKKEAEAKAWIDFQVLTEATQQSARPDMVSQQQASPLGKIILAFQNVTSQFNRIGKKAFLDIYNGRITPGNTTLLQSNISNASRIAYYFAIQNMIFYTLQTALFAVMFDDDEDDEKLLGKKERVINGSIDSILRGAGVMGAVVATMKNMAIKWQKQRDKDYNADESAVLLEMLNISPPLGIKARKIVNAEKTLQYNKKVIEEMETFDIDNPHWSAVTNYIEATTNAPTNRIYNKTQNTRQALDSQHAAWQRVLMFFGWSQYNLDIENEKMKKIKSDVKDKNKNNKKKKKKALPVF